MIKVGFVLLKDNDDGQIHKRDIFCEEIDGNHVLFIENVVYGLTLSELLDELRGNMFKLTVDGICYESVPSCGETYLKISTE